MARLTREESFEYANKNISDRVKRDIFIARYCYMREPQDLTRIYKIPSNEIKTFLEEEMRKAETEKGNNVLDNKDKKKFILEDIYYELIDLKGEDQTIDEFMLEVIMAVNQLDLSLKSFVDLRYGLNDNVSHTYEEITEIKHRSRKTIKTILIKALLEVRKIINSNRNKSKDIVFGVREILTNASQEFKVKLLQCSQSFFNQNEIVIIGMYFGLNKNQTLYEPKDIIEMFTNFDEEIIKTANLKFATFFSTLLPIMDQNSLGLLKSK